MTVGVQATFTKQSSEVKQYVFDLTGIFSNRTDTPTGVTKSSDPGITLGATISGMTLTVTVSGGVDTGVYGGTLLVSTTASLIEEIDFVVKVKDTPSSYNGPAENNAAQNYAQQAQASAGSAENSANDADASAAAAAASAAFLDSIIISPFKGFGATGDGATDDRPAIVAALSAAKLLVPAGPAASISAFSGRVKVDLGGHRCVIGDTINMTGLGGVTLANGMLIAAPTFPTNTTPSRTNGKYLIKLGNGDSADPTEPNATRFAGVENMNLECAGLAHGIDVNGVNDITLRDIEIHNVRPYGYGVRAHVSASGSYAERVRVHPVFYGDTDRPDYTKRTQIGISSETADMRWLACDAAYCETPIFISGPGTHIFTACHPFNGAANPPSWVVTGATDNGTGKLRLTFASTTGLVSGALVIVPWLKGIHTTTGASRPGVYAISNVTATTVDCVGFSFAGTFDGIWSPKVRLHAYEPEVVRIDSTAGGVMMIGCEFDNGKVVIKAGASVQFDGCFVTRNDDGTNMTGFEFLADGVADADFAGVSIAGPKSVIGPVRFTALNGGSIATPIKAAIDGGARTNGAIFPASGVKCFAEGSAAAPGLVFANIADVADDDGGAPSIDSDTGLFHTANTIGISAGGNPSLLVAQNSVTFSVAPRPATDNATDLGGASFRWAQVRAGTAAINTSDARLKTSVAPMTAAELAAARDLAREFGTYQFLDAVAAKGGAARLHVGMTVQRAIEIMVSHGLDAMAYGFICHDVWEYKPEQRDASGAIVVPAREAGDVYSFRGEELLNFIARGFEARLTALEDRT